MDAVSDERVEKFRPVLCRTENPTKQDRMFDMLSGIARRWSETLHPSCIKRGIKRIYFAFHLLRYSLQ